MPAGTVIATGAEPGEVVQAGQMIVRVARKDGRDAVFDVPAQVLRSAPSDPLDHRQPDRRSHGDGDRARAGGRPAGRPGDPDLRGQGRPDRSARGHAARLRPSSGRMQLDTAPVIEIPATALTEFDRRPAVWVVDPSSLTVSLRNVEVVRNDPGDGRHLRGARYRRDRRDRRHPGAPSRPEDPPAGVRAVTRFNLSEWALEPSLLRRVLHDRADRRRARSSYYRLGRNEDPAFTIKTMVVQAAWPGATLDDTLDQVTERLERTLQETPHLDFLRSYTSAGVTTIFVNLQGSTPAQRGPGHLVSRSQERRRHPPHPAGRRRRARLQRRVRRHLRHHLRLHRRRLHPPRAARLCRGDPLAAAARAGCLARSRSSAPRTRRSIVEFSTEKLAGLGHRSRRLIAALQAQNAVSPAGIAADRRREARAARLRRLRIRAGHPGDQFRRRTAA